MTDDEDDSSKEDRHKLLQLCQPIEKFLELKKADSDIPVEPATIMSSFSNDVPGTSGITNGHEYESLDQYYVHPSLIERWGSAMGILATVIWLHHIQNHVII